MPKKPKKKYAVIAGCNDIGAMNWGDFNSTVDDATRKRWYEQLQPYIGKEVFLAGGGGQGYSKATLTGVEMDEKTYGSQHVRVFLKNVKSMTGRSVWGGGLERDEFDPVIGSWQIIAEVN